MDWLPYTGGVEIFVFVSIICMACDSLSYLFYRREPGTSGESDVSTGLHMGIVQSFIRGTTFPHSASSSKWQRIQYRTKHSEKKLLSNNSRTTHFTPQHSGGSTSYFDKNLRTIVAAACCGDRKRVCFWRWSILSCCVLFLFIPPKNGLWFYHNTRPCNHAA